MSRSFLLSLLAAPLLAAGVAWAAHAWSAPTIVRGNLILDGIPEQSALTADKIDKLDAYLSAREARPLGFTPKGQVLIATRFGEVDQLHLIDQAQGALRQITFTREPVLRGGVLARSQPQRVLLLGRLGERIAAAVIISASAIRRRAGSPTASRSTGAALWSSSGREIAFSAIARDSGSCDIDIIDPESGALPRLAAGDEGAGIRSIGRRTTASSCCASTCRRTRNLSISSTSAPDRSAKSIRPAVKGALANAKFSRDGTGVYFISDRDGEHARLRYVNLFTAEKNDISGRGTWTSSNSRSPRTVTTWPT